MRILWTSDHPDWPTGFGNITRAVCGGLARLGHKVAIMADCRGARQGEADNLTIYPGDGRNPPVRLLRQYLRRFQPDVLVTLAVPSDGRAITDPLIQDWLRSSRVPWLFYFPLDCDCGKQLLPESIRRTQAPVSLPLVQSRFARRVVRANGIAADYLPVGVDTSRFRPSPNKHRAKQRFGYAGRFVILCDARNQIRKLLPRTLEIFRRFAADKEDAVLHLHCDRCDPAAQLEHYRYNIAADVEAMGLREKVRFTRGMSVEKGVPFETLVHLYQAADVHLLTSLGEGFGLPTLQAAAARVVPLAPAYAANPELVKGHGELLRVKTFLTIAGGWRAAFIDIDDAVAKLQRLYANRGKLRTQAQAARRFARQYDWKEIVRRWDEMLEGEVRRYHLQPDNGARTVARRTRGGVAPRQRISSVYHNIGIPVTLRPSVETPGIDRARGYVFAASAADLPVIRRLRKIFPGLTAWSTNQGDFAGDRHSRLRCKLVTTGKRTWTKNFAATTLALDIGNSEPDLPVLAARLEVPCLGNERNAKQRRLWPGLTISPGDVDDAVAKARTILADQLEAMEACATARKRRRR